MLLVLNRFLSKEDKQNILVGYKYAIINSKSYEHKVKHAADKESLNRQQV